MNIDEQNTRFNALSDLTEGQREYLIAQKRVALTKVRFTQAEALEAVGIDAFDSDFAVTRDRRLTFGGTIITKHPIESSEGVKNWREVTAIVHQRGWGETIEGMLCARVPMMDQDGDLFLHLN